MLLPPYEPSDEERAALQALTEAYHKLQQLGWYNAEYALRHEPLYLVEPGSTGVHEGSRETDGFWIIYDDGDSGPSYPVLYRRRA